MNKKTTAIIAALSDEISPLKNRIEIDSRINFNNALMIKGRLSGNSIILIRSGIGATAMASAVRYSIKQFTPSTFVHVGYCGACSPKLETGDIVLANAIIDDLTHSKYSPPNDMIETAYGVCKQIGIRHEIGKIITVGGPIYKPHDKADIGASYDAIAIDMESSALAKECEASGVKYVVARSVLDALDTELPNMDGGIDESGDTNKMALLGNVISNPKKLMKIPKIAYCANQARKSITSFVDTWIK